MAFGFNVKLTLFAVTTLLLSNCVRTNYYYEDYQYGGPQRRAPEDYNQYNGIQQRDISQYQRRAPEDYYDYGGPQRRAPEDYYDYSGPQRRAVTPSVNNRNINGPPQGISVNNRQVQNDKSILDVPIVYEQKTCSGGPDFTAGSDPKYCVEGRLAVGRNGRFEGFSVGATLDNAFSNKPCKSFTVDDLTLVVGGTATIISGRVFGGIVIDESAGPSKITKTIHLNPNCFIRGVKSQDLDGLFDLHEQLTKVLSKVLDDLEPTLEVVWDDHLWGWKVVRLCESKSGKFDVLRISRRQMQTLNIVNWEEVVRILGRRSLLINIRGVDVSGNNYDALKPIADRIVWNWGTDRQVTIQWVSFYGSILAPFATITGSGSIYGQVVAQTIRGGLNLHRAPFRGCLPKCDDKAPEWPGQL